MFDILMGLLVIGAATDIVVCRGGFGRLWRIGDPVKARGKNGSDRAVVDGVVAQGAITGGLKAFRAIFTVQTEDPQSRAIALFPLLGM